ncbi:MAG: choice-of-anchor J domain-containing protein [Duncaniella sp.]|nr:choice-of-anchor J domain-containing protein [Duncaniella sp.]
MNKIFTRLLSAALAVSIVVPATAAPEMIARSIQPGSSALGEICATAQLAMPKRMPIPGVDRRNDLRTSPTGLRDGNPNAPFGPAKTAKAPKVVTRTEQTGPLPTLIGGVIYSLATKNNPKLLKQVPVNPEVQEYETLITNVSTTGGGVLKDGTYIATDYYSFFGMWFVTVVGYDLESKAKVFSYTPNAEAYIFDGLAVDPTTDKIYGVGISMTGDSYQLSTVEYTETEATITHVATFNYNVNSIAFDAQGQLYGIIYASENSQVMESSLVKIDKTNGNIQVIGVTGEIPQYRTGSCIDPKTGKMYWALCNDEQKAYLCEVNLTTGAATRLYEIPDGDQIKGLQVVPPPAEDGAPAAATDLSLEFPNGTLTGNVNFSIPATHFDGSAATGEVTYTVKANGETVATGTSTFGSEVSAVVELTKPAEYEFVVILTNEVGDSPKSRIKGFIGNGIPVAPEAEIAYADGQITITWQPITESVDSGYIAADAMRYSIKNLANGEILAEDLAVTTWSTEYPEPEELTRVTYGVTAICNEISSATTEVSIVLGSIVPPYSNTFDSAADMTMFTIIDANGDGKTWHFSPDNNAPQVDYNNMLAADDWMISPALKLEANSAYWVSIDAKGQASNSPEQFELCAGTTPTVAGMIQKVIEPTEIRSEQFNTYGGYIITDEAGIYYLGIHGISKRNMYALTIDNLSIAAGAPALAPKEVTDFEIVAGPYGALFANITFNAPTKNVKGDDLTEITKIEIARDGEIFAVKTNVQPGAAVKVADSVDEHGTYTYTVTCYNEEGEGETATKQAYIGVPVPAPVSSVTVSVENPKVTLTWPAVTRDMYDNPIAADQVTYTIIDEGNNILAEGIKGTSYTYEYTGKKQEFMRFGVQSVTEGGRQQGVYGTHLIPLGPAYDGLEASFPNGEVGQYNFYITTNGGNWIKCTDDGLNGTSKFTEIKSYDGDNGFLAMEGKNVDNSATLVSGLVSLKNAEKPGVSFFTYVLYDGDNLDTNEITVSVVYPDSVTPIPVKTIVVSDLGSAGWRKVTVPLDEYAGQDVQIAITATTKAYAYTAIDNLKIGALTAKDLSAHAIQAPAKVVAGNDYSVVVEVVNEGFDSIAGYSVELYADGELAATQNITNGLAAEKSEFVEFVRSFSPFATESVIYMAQVVFDGDTYTANNQTNEIVVEPMASELPAATDLKGEATDAGNVLTWGEPDLSNVLPDSYTETFEDAEGFETEFKDWIFIDVDSATIGGLSGYTLPGIPTGTGPASWFVFDASNEQYNTNTTFYGANGSKDKHFLCSMYRKDLKQVDDWAISPELKGIAQTITLMAKAYNQFYAEKFEVYYSTGSTDIADFVQVGETTIVKTQTWTQYSFDLPEGAKRFAIRACSVNAYMLYIDDVTFIPADAQVSLTLAGYDVYRDGVKINSEVITETTFTDTEAEHNKEYTYNVVAIFDRGAAIPSNDCTLTTTGLDSLFGGIAITAGKGEVVITGAEGMAVQVVAVDGKVLFSGLGEAKTTVAVMPGVYVVKAGDKVAKILVR